MKFFLRRLDRDASLTRSLPRLAVILFIDEIHLIMAGKGGGGMDAANLLKPMLARGKLRCIGATTLNEVSPSFLSRRVLHLL